MNDLIQVLYNFVIENTIDCSVYKRDSVKKNIYLYVSYVDSREFLKLFEYELKDLIDQYGYADITLLYGYITIDIYDMIWYYHNEAERKEWIQKFEEYAEGLPLNE